MLGLYASRSVSAVFLNCLVFSCASADENLGPFTVMTDELDA